MPNEEPEVQIADQRSSKDKRAKGAFVRGFENLIFSGQYKAGDRIPAERELSKNYRLSRPVIHDALIELANKGFVTISPRKGTFVNDIRRLGSLDLLASFFSYTEGQLSRKLYESLLEFRLLFEIEAVRKAARRRNQADLDYLGSLVEEERELMESAAEAPSPLHPENAADLDFRFHLALMLASGNEIYPMFFNSFRKLNMAILRKHYQDRSMIAPGFRLHADLAAAVSASDEDAAERILREILMATDATIPETGQERPA
jgi:DNA-binding FadR family transcriptional regulator